MVGMLSKGMFKTFPPCPLQNSNFLIQWHTLNTHICVQVRACMHTLVLETLDELASYSILVTFMLQL
eukprot:c48288_g1_i1 orf=82-282(-)